MKAIVYFLLILFSSTGFAVEEIQVQISSEMKEKAAKLTNIKIDPSLEIIANEAQTKAKGKAKQWDVAKFLLGEDSDPAQEPSDKATRQYAGKLYVFISKSTPLKTLQTYARVLERLGHGVMVMNGFVGDPVKMKPTLKFISEVLKKDQYCDAANCEKYRTEIQVNPILFRKYTIQRVPAFVWEKSPKEKYCDDDLQPLSEHETLVLEGDADLIYVLNEIQRHSQSAEVGQLLKEYETL